MATRGAIATRTLGLGIRAAALPRTAPAASGSAASVPPVITSPAR